MKVLYKSNNGQFEAEFDAKDQREMFEQVAAFQEVFEQSYKDSSGPYKLVHRQDKDKNDYYEVHHTGKPYKVLRFGCNKQGRTLFPKRLDDDGQSLKEGGWVDPYWVTNAKN